MTGVAVGDGEQENLAWFHPFRMVDAGRRELPRDPAEPLSARVPFRFPARNWVHPREKID